LESLATALPRRRMGLIGLVRVRWWIFLYMFLFPLLCFMQRNSLDIATNQVKVDLHVSQFQVFVMLTSFQIMYTALQIPSGALGQRLGGRLTFVWLGAVACLATMATPLAPIAFSGAAVVLAMSLSQALLGVAQSPLFPVSTGLLESWFPSAQWGYVIGVQSSAMHVGTAVSAPLIVALSAALGWQRALLWTAVPLAVLTVCWAWYGRDTPQQHPAVDAAELAELDGGGHEPPARPTLRRCLHLIGDRNLLVLAISYLCMNVAFFLLFAAPFLYLTQHRHMSEADGGWLAALPPAGAAVGAWLGGVLTDRLVERYGLRWGHRLIPLLSLPAVAVLLLLAVNTPYLTIAIGCFVLAYGLVELNEGPVGAATMQIARADTMTGWGVVNTGGNLGGVVLLPLLGYLSGRGDWNLIFAIAAGSSLVSGALWFLVSADQRFVPPAATSDAVAGSQGVELR
jgi:MFS transporter, ACS family, glucarate transporter